MSNRISLKFCSILCNFRHIPSELRNLISSGCCARLYDSKVNWNVTRFCKHNLNFRMLSSVNSGRNVAAFQSVFAPLSNFVTHNNFVDKELKMLWQCSLRLAPNNNSIVYTLNGTFVSCSFMPLQNCVTGYFDRNTG